MINRRVFNMEVRWSIKLAMLLCDLSTELRTFNINTEFSR